MSVDAVKLFTAGGGACIGYSEEGNGGVEQLGWG